MIIGVCGGSGAGKTTLLNRLANHFEHLEPAVFSMDNYYHPLADQVKDEKDEVNFDLPTALDEKRLVADLRRLHAGEIIEVPEYQFNTRLESRMITIRPSRMIIVEGLFLFHYTAVRELIDFSIFVDVDQQIQLDRRLNRDQELRGYSREAILYQWEHHVAPCFEQFLLPYRHEADFLFRNDYRADEEFARLLSELKNRM